MIDGRAFDSLFTVLAVLAGLCLVFIPLGIWKLIDLFRHFHVSIAWN